MSNKSWYSRHDGNTFYNYTKLEGVRFKWCNDWWDGPLEGVAIYEDKDYYFFLDHEDLDVRNEEPFVTRYFLLIELTEEEMAQEVEQRNRFEKYVSTGFKFEEDGKTRIDGEVRPRSEHRKFYDWYDKLPDKDFSSNKVVGYFIWGE